MLKPAEAQKIAAVLSSAVEKLKHERNHRQQTSYWWSAITGHDGTGLYSMIQRAKEDELLEQLKPLNIHRLAVDSGSETRISAAWRRISGSCLACQIDRSTILYVPQVRWKRGCARDRQMIEPRYRARGTIENAAGAASVVFPCAERCCA
ncbi:MAG: hypothetical protein ACLVJX_09880 [Merdibacter sp.]